MSEVASESKAPASLDSRKVLSLGIRLPASDLSPWPWQATMLTALNSYLIWGLFWLHFVIALSTFSYRGLNLWYYTTEASPFNRSIPEIFLGFLIAASTFSFIAVIGGTGNTPRLWKRLVPVLIISTIAIGFSLLILHLRHNSYERAIEFRSVRLDDYHRNLVTHHDEEDKRRTYWLDRDLKRLAEMDAAIFSYEEKYRLPHVNAHPLEHSDVPR